MAHAQTKSAPVGATMKASLENRLAAIERSIAVLWQAKIGWKWGIPAHLAVVSLLVFYLEARFDRQHDINLVVADRLRVVEMNQVRFDARQEKILENQEEIIRYIRGQ